jgi:hypothetical protein
MRDDRPMREHALANLGSMVSEAEVLRTAPDAPVGDADRSAYASLLGAARQICEVDDSPGIEGVDDPARLADVARLHRSAGLLEHELLVRLAEARAAARRAQG